MTNDQLSILLILLVRLGMFLWGGWRHRVNADCFRMTVAIGASCAFLTPVGHQNNTLILGPGGFRFGDYWKAGAPLEILVAAVSIPLLLVFWPL